MQVGDYVSFQGGLDRRILFGTLIAVDPEKETGTIECDGKTHVRVLGRIRTAARGLKEQVNREKKKWR